MSAEHHEEVGKAPLMHWSTSAAPTWPGPCNSQRRVWPLSTLGQFQTAVTSRTGGSAEKQVHKEMPSRRDRKDVSRVDTIVSMELRPHIFGSRSWNECAAANGRNMAPMFSTSKSVVGCHAQQPELMKSCARRAGGGHSGRCSATTTHLDGFTSRCVGFGF